MISGTPSYTSIKRWVNEQINLNSYIGQKIRIRFNLVTDNGVPGDGFYFNNFKVVNYKDEGTSVVLTNLNVPSEYKLYQNYPNPFNPVTHLEFGIPSFRGESELVSLKVYDLLGKEIAVLVNEKLSPGNYIYEFDGSKIPSGTYIYKLESGNFSEVRKMILLK